MIAETVLQNMYSFLLGKWVTLRSWPRNGLGSVRKVILQISLVFGRDSSIIGPKIPQAPIHVCFVG